jgi:hypothetical protein
MAKPNRGLPIVDGMRHQRPDAACPLCPVWGIPYDPKDRSTWGRQHEHAYRLWSRWDGRPGWEGRVCEEAAKLGIACTPEQAREHFLRHRPEQPAYMQTLDRERLLAEALSFSDRCQRIIDCVYRQRLLSTDQITELFYAASASNWQSAHTMARQDLGPLARRHFLYGYWPSKEAAKRRDAPKHFANRLLYFLGRASVPFIEDRYHDQGLQLRPDHYVIAHDQVGLGPLIHDLRTNGLVVAIHRALRLRGRRVQLPDGSETIASCLTDNWYGPKHLQMGFTDPRTREHREINPDAFATISLARSRWNPRALPACQLPFFIEYDHGGRKLREVSEQLLSYHRLAVSGAVAKRFPDLAVEGYAVPVVMVFSDPKRVRTAHKRFLEHAHAHGLTDGSPMLLCAERDWLEDPFACPATLAWDTQARTFTFLDLLLRASRRLIDARALFDTQSLTLKLRAARPRLQGSFTREARERMAKRRRRERQAAEQAQREQAQRALLDLLDLGAPKLP